MDKQVFLIRAKFLKLENFMSPEDISLFIKNEFYELLEPDCTIEDILNVLQAYHDEVKSKTPRATAPPQNSRQAERQISSTKNNVQRKLSRGSNANLIASILIGIILFVGLIFLASKVTNFFGNGSKNSSGVTSDCGQPNSMLITFGPAKTTTGEGQNVTAPEKYPSLVAVESYICFKDEEMKTFLAQTIQTSQGNVDGRMALASLITKQTAITNGKVGQDGKVSDMNWARGAYNLIFNALDPQNFKVMNKPGYSYVVLPGLQTVDSSPANSGSQANPIDPGFTPLSSLGTTQSVVQAASSTALDRYIAIAGDEIGRISFTANAASQCFATFSANWQDFTSKTPLNEVLRLLGPAGFSIRPNDQTGTTFIARSLDTDASGFTACIVVSGVMIQYPEGNWQITGPNNIGSIHWFRTVSDITEVQIGEVFVYPVYSDRPTPVPTIPVTPVIYISNLAGWMVQQGFTELMTPNCPYEPLSGQLSLTTPGGNVYVVIVDLSNDTASAIRYGQYACTQAGGLHFYTVDPGQPNTTNLGGVYVWPYAKPQVQWPTQTPGSTTVLPSNGANVSLIDLLKYLETVGQTDAFVSCSPDAINGSIPGWPNAVPVQVNVNTYLVDFSPISANIDTTTLCHYVTVNGTIQNGQGIHLTSNTSIAPQYYPWITWNNWLFTPFH